jgi:hypothetical protein
MAVLGMTVKYQYFIQYKINSTLFSGNAYYRKNTVAPFHVTKAFTAVDA